jgi:hypothetical protein
MISDYKFQDLAKFIEDVKFLIGKDGGAGFASVAGGGTTIEIIFRIIKLFLLWVVLIIIIYVIYKIIFYGYPRFPVDLMKFKLNNKVNVKSVVGDVNGPLYKYVMLLKEPRMADALSYFNKQGFMLLNEECNSDNCISIFHDLDRIITDEYESEFNATSVEEAINNYYKYYESITAKLGLIGVSSQNRITKLKNVYDSVFIDYLTYYSNEILLRENSIQCMKNNGKDDKKRGELNEVRKTLVKELETLMKSINCKKVDTECEFARLFVDPNHTLTCNDDMKKLVEQQLQRMGYKEKHDRYKQLQKSISDKKRKLNFSGLLKKKDKRETKNKIASQKKEQDIVKIQIIDMKREATEIVKQSLKNKPPSLPIANPTYKDVIVYQGEDRVYPNTNRNVARDKNIQYTVYVPCYDLYKQYYVVNRETMFANFSGPSENGMTEDEIIAYIFLSDVEKLMYNVEMKKNSNSSPFERKPTLIERFLNTYISIENMTGKISEILSSPESPIQYAKYLLFSDENTIKSSIAELDKYKKDIQSFYRNFDIEFDEYFLINYHNKVRNITVQNDYTYYLMEVFAYMTELQGKKPSGEMDFIYDRYVRHLSLFEYNKSALIAYLNLPVLQQKNEEIRRNFGISSPLAYFIKTHPLFSLLYLQNSVVNPKNTYHNIMTMFLDLVSGNKKLTNTLYNIQNANMQDTEELLNVVQNKAYEIKEIIVSLHMINIYFTHYRDSVAERDPVSKVKISRDGLVEIYDQQNISPAFAAFFGRLFEPFKREFLDGKIKASWKKAFIARRFNPNLKEDKWNLSYWRDFNSFWVDFMGKKMDGMMKQWWKNFKNYTKPRKF